MSGNNNSDWLDDYIIMSMIEDDENEADDSDGEFSCHESYSTSRRTISSNSKSNDIGCSTILLVFVAIYIILNLLAN